MSDRGNAISGGGAENAENVPHGTCDAAGVTAEGAEWLASAGMYPRSTLALWEAQPTAPVVLPCGTAFDVVNVPAIFGRRMLDRLWEEGPGSGPVATYGGRVLLFASSGTAQRLPTLLDWEDWNPGADGRTGRRGAVPPLLCHGTGDAVTVPALTAPPAARAGDRPESRWLVAPDTRHPWLPGPEVLLWAAVRAARATASAAVRISIFPPADQGAKVYDVSKRR
ncbi:bifunctional DNA primase/polymerase [Streptomyces sp. NPDC059785]|uniref:bifunctional DNA primase/polymerase n=1 Tax=unclassified Streptomyces TaxID=2593676 RepID=UPI0036635C23